MKTKILLAVTGFLAMSSIAMAGTPTLMCGSTKIEVGAKKADVIKACGAPAKNKSYTKNEDDLTVQVIKYVQQDNLANNATTAITTKLSFVDGGLVKVKYESEATNYDL